MQISFSTELALYCIQHSTLQVVNLKNFQCSLLLEMNRNLSQLKAVSPEQSFLFKFVFESVTYFKGSKICDERGA